MNLWFFTSCTFFWRRAPWRAKPRALSGSSPSLLGSAILTRKRRSDRIEGWRESDRDDGGSGGERAAARVPPHSSASASASPPRWWPRRRSCCRCAVGELALKQAAALSSGGSPGRALASPNLSGVLRRALFLSLAFSLSLSLFLFLVVSLSLSPSFILFSTCVHTHTGTSQVRPYQHNQFEGFYWQTVKQSSTQSNVVRSHFDLHKPFY